ncbi:unnamed protein product [Choristocarpus tenellus]
MLREKDKSPEEGKGADIDAEVPPTEDGPEEEVNTKEGKFEYVSGEEQGTNQVLGGVSDEIAAAQPAAVENKDENEGHDDMEEGMEAMPLSEDADDVDTERVEDGVQRGEDGDASKFSGHQRRENGPRADKENQADNEVGSEEDKRTGDDSDEDVAREMEEELREGKPNATVVTNIGSASKAAEDDRLEEDLQDLAQELQLRVGLWQDGGMAEDRMVNARELWGRLRAVTGTLSQRLCEQLRLVLEPMVASKLQGDYRSGKRINMRRVISYIASGFRKDKIWLRRTKPAKRDYQILLAIDDSESMADCGAGALALAALATVSSGLNQLESGQVAVARFGKDLEVLHAFEDALTEEAGAKIVSGFGFDQARTNTAVSLQGILTVLEEARSGFSFSLGGAGGGSLPRQLVLLISDGRFDRENKDNLRRMIREMNERGQMLVLIVVDREGDTSILKTREASYVGGKLVLSSYLDNYPFPFYILLHHIEALPETLADALRQWFELLQRQQGS